MASLDDQNIDKTAWWDKQPENTNQKPKKKDKSPKKKKEEVVEVNFNNPLTFNEGDVEFEPVLKPLLTAAGEAVPEIPAEILRRLFS